jgi:hypothetical protein
VTTQIRGGIGNQLFIYAMVRRLSLMNGVPLYLDIKSGFQGDRYRRTYGLSVFKISGEEIAAPRFSQGLRRSTIVLNTILPFSKRWFLREKDGGFESRYLDLKVKRPVFLEGYWQDERYFSDIRLQLREDLTFNNPYAEESASLVQMMRNSESVAVHVRQSDVEKLPWKYYRWAIARIKERIPHPRLYLFCDNPELMGIPGVEGELVRVTNTGDDAQYKDMFLMSQCRHYVIANSTFSWWATWLGRTTDSIVASPVMHEWKQLVRIPVEWGALEWSRQP